MQVKAIDRSVVRSCRANAPVRARSPGLAVCHILKTSLVVCYAVLRVFLKSSCDEIYVQVFYIAFLILRWILATNVVVRFRERKEVVCVT